MEEWRCKEEGMTVKNLSSLYAPVRYTTSNTSTSFFLSKSKSRTDMTTTYGSPDGYTSETVGAFEALQHTIINCSFAASLLPVFLILLIYSPARVRKTLTFWILIICFSFGIFQAYLSFRLGADEVASRLYPNHYVFAASTVILVAFPTFIDSTLLFKIMTLYSPQPQSRRTRWIIIALLISLKAIRLIVAIAYFIVLIPGIKNLHYNRALIFFTDSTLLLVGYWLQLLDSACSSALLLYKGYGLECTTTTTPSKPPSRIRTWIEWSRQFLCASLACYVIPCVIRIALVASRHYYTFRYSVYLGPFAASALQSSNFYISLHCAAYATIWSNLQIHSTSSSSLKRVVVASPLEWDTATASESRSSSFGESSEADSLFVFRFNEK